jgi:hypothetical protein
MSGSSAGSFSGLPESSRVAWTLVRKNVTLAHRCTVDFGEDGVDPGEAQNAKNQRVARFIPWT